MNMLTDLGLKLVKEIENLSFPQLIRIRNDLIRRLKEQHGIALIVPKKVNCRFSTSSTPHSQQYLTNLSWFWCRNCGYIFCLKGFKNMQGKKIKCPICNSNVQQAYVYAPHPKSIPYIPTMSTAIYPITSSIKIWCRRLEEYKRVKRTNLMRPIASLKYVCPNPSLATQKRCPYISSNSICKDGGIYAKQRTGIRWALTPLSEDITKPLSISIFRYNNGESRYIEHKTLTGIEKMIFVENITVLQVTICAFVGHPFSHRRRRAPILYYDKESDVFYLPSRILKTNGLVIKVDSNIYNKLLNDNEKRFELLHSISHAFLSRLPMVTGLEAYDFAEAINTEEGEILIYENSLGGIGGIEGILEENSLRIDYEDMVRRSIQCPLECPRACKACLYSDSCYMLNWKLDRHLIQRVMRWI